MRTPVTLSTGRGADGQLVVSATGELDMTNIDAFNQALTDALTQADGSPVQVDLRGVEYLDSGAINALFPYADRIHILANPTLMPVLTVSGLTDVTRVDPGSR
jgi:anti-anti-sigma factor